MTNLKNSTSPLAVDVITNGRDYMRAKIVEPSGQHELSWYQKVEGGEWERKVRPLTDEEAAICQKEFQRLIREDGVNFPDEVYAILGLEHGTPATLYQLTMVDKSKR
jgi:hypothetical protein